MNKKNDVSPEMRERAERRVKEYRGGCPSLSAAAPSLPGAIQIACHLNKDTQRSAIVADFRSFADVSVSAGAVTHI